MKAKPKIVLALGGGVARGWAHIGVLKTLTATGYAPDVICGTSIGALVGGIYLAGKLDALETWARALTQRKVFGLLDFTFGGSGLFAGEKLAKLLEEQVGDICIETLNRPYVAVATELDTGREVWIRDGSLVQAMRASYALPGVFSPVERDGHWLCDGALVNPCPTSAARSFGGHIVIAVSLHTDIVGSPDDNLPPPTAPLPAQESALSRWLRPDRMIMERIFADRPDGPALSTVMVGALNILLDRVTRARLAGDPPDVLIAPHVAPIGLIEFHRAAEIIELGAKAARDALPTIKHAVDRLAR
ncbi:MAG: patatin-like phospholipase family protein [Alphaproteobacteria bacterium]|nr:patatin-like phospholipase family protein [Alphaproteobacteria bacterium]